MISRQGGISCAAALALLLAAGCKTATGPAWDPSSMSSRAPGGSTEAPGGPIDSICRLRPPEWLRGRPNRTGSAPQLASLEVQIDKIARVIRWRGELVPGTGQDGFWPPACNGWFLLLGVDDDQNVATGQYGNGWERWIIPEAGAAGFSDSSFVLEIPWDRDPAINWRLYLVRLDGSCAADDYSQYDGTTLGRAYLTAAAD